MRSVSRNIFAATALVAAIPGALLARISERGRFTAIEQLRTLREDLRRTHAANDTAAYLSSARTMHDFLNGSPNSLLQLMLAEVVADKDQDALESLQQLVRMGQSNEDVLRTKQFDALRAQPQYSSLHTAMVSNDVSISVSSKVFALTETRLLPEDIDYDPTTKLFYITSVFKKEIVTGDMTGAVHVFASGPDKWPMMALKVDAQRHLLWATEVALDGFSWSPSEDWGRSMVLLYDLRTGKLLWRVEGPARAAFGDMTLTAEGDAVLSDGEGGGVYRISRKRQQIERLDAGDFISPQTPVMLPGDKRALVPDYVRGIGILNLETKQISWVPMAGRYALSGIDGLYLSGRMLIAIQNGTSPKRVVRFELDRSFSRVESESIIERSTPTLGDPTHGVRVDGRFYYIANSGWDMIDEHGQLKPGASMPEALIMSVDINPSR